MRTISFAAVLLLAFSAFANPSGQWTLLIPINPGTIPGNNGAVWATSLWVTNTGDTDATVTCDQSPCPVLKAHSTTQLAAPPVATPHQGFFLGVMTTFIIPIPGNSIYAEERATDSVTAAHSAGTEIPAVPPSAFKSTTIAMPHVPVNGHSRSMLRVYGFTNGTAKVRVIGVQSNRELMNAVVSLTGEDPSRIPQIPLLRWPSYTELPLPDAYSSTDEAVRIEITPTDGNFIWGLVSVTDNASQQFTLITPATGEYWIISNA